MPYIKSRANRAKYGPFHVSRKGGLTGRQWQRVSLKLPLFRDLVLWERKSNAR